jgi:hypothetical protein
MINKKDYSLLLIQTVERLFNKLRKFVDENGEILELSKNEPFHLVIEDKSKKSNFKFSISDPKQDNKNKILFTTEYNPQNTVLASTKKMSAEERTINTLFDQWINLLHQYNRVKLSPEESILNEYEKEFYENFEILDEDADTQPYELEKQVIIHNYFVQVINILELNESENKELITEAKIIKENIPKMTKKTTVKSISSFFAKVRKKGLPLLKELLEAGKKEIFKKAIKAGFELIGEITALIG